MLKKLLLLFFFNLTLITTGWGASDYLKVSGWHNCVKTLNQPYYKYFCLPSSKPEGCSDSAWAALKKSQSVPECPLCPPKK